MARPPRWHATLEASIEEACLAVRLYNDPAEGRAFEAFVVHMHLAWLYLLHAEFIRDGVDYRYWNKKHTRLERIDGEPKRWELERSLKERWAGTEDPVSANLRMFIGLRNRLEHRHANADQALMLALAGHAHALLINYENEVTSQFGGNHSLALRLRIPLFVGTFSDQGEQALRQLRKSLPSDLQGFLTQYYADLEDEVTDDPRFEFRLRATVELAPKDPDAVAIQYTRLDDMTEEEKALVEEMGRKGQVVTRNRRQPVSGLGMLLPKAVVNEVQADLPYVFNMSHFVAAYKNLKVRPERGSANPENTNADWCAYHEPTSEYLYTRAFVKYLIKKCSTPEGFTTITGRMPKVIA